METLVGIVIALVTVVAVQRVVVASETTRRHAQSDADAQQAAQFALARLSTDLANAGAGIATAANALSACPATGDFAAITRPVTALITDGGNASAPDSVVVRYTLASGITQPSRVAAATAVGAPLPVRATLGFNAGDALIVSDRRGSCVRTVTTAVRGSAVDGVLDVEHAPAVGAMPADAVVLNLGTAARVVATRYDVSAQTLRTTDLSGGDAPNPLISNVVNLKLQYGIDSDGDGTLDTWTPATAAGAVGDWSPNAMLAAPIDVLRRIKALRVGVIVRGEHPDRAATAAFDWVMFDCDAADKSTCPGRLAGSIAASVRGGWHYRVYETVVPLRNVAWNR